MAAQAGLDMLIKISDNGASDGTMVAAAGLRSKSISLNAEPVDVTSGSSAGRWRELLSGKGVKSAAVSGSGVFLDDATDEDVRGHFFAGENAYLEIIIPDFGTIAGAFHIDTLEYAGDHDGDQTWNHSYSSAGALTWTPAS